MSYQKLAKSYKTTSIETASPGQLILMLYDGALRHLDNSISSFNQPVSIQRNESIHNSLMKVQSIVAELQSCLDMEIKGEFPKTMHQLYDYVYSKIQDANVKKTSEHLVEVKKILQEIRDSWKEMLQQSKNEKKARKLWKNL